jgi:hypothetical protein
MNAGFDAHMAKPVEFSKLEEVLLRTSTASTRESKNQQPHRDERAGDSQQPR